MFEYYSVKIVLIFFVCSGIFNLLAGTYLGFTKKRTVEPTKLQASWPKLLLRGISTEVLSLTAFMIFRRGLFGPWYVLIVFMALIAGTEFLIAMVLNRSLVPSGNR
jgi:hypothetical protein